ADADEVVVAWRQEKRSRSGDRVASRTLNADRYRNRCSHGEAVGDETVVSTSRGQIHRSRVQLGSVCCRGAPGQHCYHHCREDGEGTHLAPLSPFQAKSCDCCSETSAERRSVGRWSTVSVSRRCPGRRAQYGQE